MSPLRSHQSYSCHQDLLSWAGKELQPVIKIEHFTSGNKSVSESFDDHKIEHFTSGNKSVSESFDDHKIEHFTSGNKVSE